MRYQLVLQFKGDSLADYDEMIALEDRLIGVVGKTGKVDGHDCGSGETNIFIHSSAPKTTFSAIRPTLIEKGKLEFVTAAYREANGEIYTILWPENAVVDFRIS